LVGEVLDVYCNSDVTNIAKNRNYDSLDKPVKDVLSRNVMINLTQLLHRANCAFLEERSKDPYLLQN